MQTLRAENLHRTYGEKTLFDNLNFIINEHDRIGLIGVNGSGKTSLLNTLAGISNEQTGELATPKDYTIGYLTQKPDLDENLTVMDAVFSGDQKVFVTIRRYEAALAAYGAHPDDEQAQKRYLDAEAQMNEEDAWTAESDVKTILTQLKITDLSQEIKTMSGGQVKRVGLAQVLIQSPDLLLLDEPTNHLDFDSIAWLQQYLTSYKGALLVVTHDRYFLDQVANQIWELDFGKLYQYPGNYQAYVQEKAERVNLEAEAEQKQQRLYQQELAWMKAGAKARSTKQQARINRFNDIASNVGTRQVEHHVAISLGQQRLGKKVIELKDANLSLGGHTILNDFSDLIQAGERIGISGENGAGKSSLLNVIAQRLPLDSGIVTVGETVKMAYYTQQIEPIPEDKRMINYLSEVGQTVTDKQGNSVSVTELLEQFLFPRFMHGTLIRKLSGGEKRRLYLLKLLMEQPNVLLLDEPTNDLDISTLTVLEDYISQFSGTVITVSHDRYFLDKVADRLLIFTGNGQIERYSGQFSSYLAAQQAQTRQATKAKSKPAAPKESAPAKPKQKVKLTYAEQKEWEGIESVIDDLESQKSAVQEAMNANGANYDKLADLQAQLDDLDHQLDDKMARWEYLSEYAE
ncbi:ABC-F family ATP-binding cassette domain-containing protein [Levilactobacillus brevis]|uniref:ABC-F family ATP-binding cassette domain-containing protein n=1 Tax=Levilactobacillus brevis TaxID=1580 RepID=UPI000BE79E11|nr:ABC-F family ATP-binding cassette domain-containing protein [Levilactobacillus brevis]MBT9678129.1 ATP-binding cassette domain-containing protein [Levilactobacillus brevis]MCP9613359.1 ABC-F family ATP-binding cassette domain-containing protein [Levilactobacillus brevis]MCZ2120428.1 ABC-F family ATP-binding cassette domain-containing protein [Levilactobacillus brevis]MCZ2125916.1 ABC-F family ATP-binding cassette domain-containing protein [Levilactobacillus brevis]MCZ2210236.1 ABC-F family 